MFPSLTSKEDRKSKKSKLSPLWHCPITSEVMFDPVIVFATGFSYEREALEKHLKQSRNDPLNRQVIIPEGGYGSNRALQQIIQEAAEDNPIEVWESTYISERHRADLKNAAIAGNEVEFSRLLARDPRVIYESIESISLVEFLSLEEKRCVCIRRVIGYARNNPLGGFAKLKEVTDTERLFFNLAKKNQLEIINELSQSSAALSTNSNNNNEPNNEFIYFLSQADYINFYFKACEQNFVEALAIFQRLNIPLHTLDKNGLSGIQRAALKNARESICWLIKNIENEKLSELLLQPMTLPDDSLETVFGFHFSTVFDFLSNQNFSLKEIIREGLVPSQNQQLFTYAVHHKPEIIGGLSIMLAWDQSFYQKAAKRALLIDMQILDESIKRGANIDHCYMEERGKSLLHLVVIAALGNEDLQGNLKFIEFLLEKKINVWIRDAQDRIALDYIAVTPSSLQDKLIQVLAPFHDSLKLFRYFLEKYEYVISRSKPVMSFIGSINSNRLMDVFKSLGWDEKFYHRCAFKFVEEGQLKFLKVCLSLGVKPNVKGDELPYQSEYLVTIAIRGDLVCVKELLDRGADINVRTSNGNTLLHEAVRHNKKAIALELLERGLGVHNRRGKSENNSQQTAEEYAQSLQNLELAEAIKRRRYELKYQFLLKPLEAEKDSLRKEVDTLKAQKQQEIYTLKTQKQQLVPLLHFFKNSKKVWETNIGCHADTILALIVLPDGRVVSGGMDKLIKVWNLNSNNNATHSNTGHVALMQGHTSTIFDLALICENKYLASASGDNTIKIWNISNFSCVTTLAENKGIVDCIAELSNKYLVSGTRDKAICIWEIKNLSTYSGYPTYTGYSTYSSSPCRCVCTFTETIAPTCLLGLPGKDNNCYFVCGYANGSIKIWDATVPEKLKEVFAYSISPNGYPVRDLYLLPNGHLASASSTGTITILDINDLKSPRLIRTLAGHQAEVTRLTSLMKGQYLVSGSADKTIMIWDLEKGTCIAKLEGHTHSVWALAALPDDCSIVSGEGNNQANNKEGEVFNLKQWGLPAIMMNAAIEKIENSVPECKMM